MPYYYLLSPCPPSYHLPFDALITASWAMLAVLCLDLVVTVGSLALPPRRMARSKVATLLTLLLGAPVALGLLFSLQRQNLALCLIPGDLHMTPQTVAMLVAAYTHAVQRASVQAHTTFAAVAGIAFLGTLATLATQPGARRLRWPRRASHQG